MKHHYPTRLLSKTNIAVSLFLILLLCPPVIMAQQNINSGNDAASVEDYITLSKSYQGVSVDKSLKYSNEALILARRLASDSLIAKAYKSLGTANYNAANFKESVVCWDSALFYFRKFGNILEEKRVFNNLGVVHAQLGNYQTAVDYYMNCLNMHKMQGDSAGTGHIYNNLGALYYELRAFKEALPYFEKARVIAVQGEDVATQMHTSNNIGLILTELNKYQEAHKSFQESIIIAKKLGNAEVLAAATQNIGNIYMFQKQSDSALKYFHQGLELSESIGKVNAHACLGIGWCWHQKGMHDKALSYFNQAYDIAKNSGDQKVMLDALRNIYKTSSSKGNKLEAYTAAVNYISMFDSVNSTFDSTAILNLQAKYLVNEKIHEIQNLRLQEQQHKEQLSEQKNLIKNQKALLHLSVTALIIFILLLILLFRFSRKYKSTSSALENQNQMNLKTAIDLQILNKTLTEQEEILRTLLETSPDTIQFKDDKGHWIKANQALLELFDLKDVDYQMKTDRDLAKIKPFFKETFESCMISDEMTWYKKQSTRSDEVIPMIQGGFKILDVIKVALYNKDGSRKGLIVIGRDITRRKEAEMQLNTALAKAEESDRLKSAFLRNMSHEIRTPLNAIIGFSDLLREDIIHDSERKEYLRLIEENGDALLSLITDIIDLAQVEAGDAKVNYTQFDLVELINDEHKHFNQILEKKNKTHLEFHLQLLQSSLVILSDILKIRQIIVNLLNNAVKFTDKGSISLELTIVSDDDPDTKWIQITVSDTGTGIPEGKKEFIFDHFSKFSDDKKRIYGGTGLGLSIVHKNVKLLKGTIEVESEENKGTSIMVNLPLILAKGISKPSPKQRKIPDYRGKTILIAEDVQSSFDLLKALLDPTGVSLLHANDGLEAVQMCEKYEEINLVLMDIQLPQMNGFEATRRIKKFRPLLPIIAQTAFAMPDEKEACLASGCDGYFTKPLRSELLMPVISEILDIKSDNY